ncbi:unnamed protein product (macronuclear) [Paramecium tetraurelia]|uniref:Uncharacterized protein n=1 Tax=Paramecium tetraurelia TaxID=5888 RepID=A0E658_PARTE|nr:uncharacterized protein GSPATT00003639001 [Paramecium tetraurelia]CAK90775.1 unnamed protein product [Paramecium tetraurelia]|eukprot:XP_001458172.1 hypothetical protein (macronuclear) [Paramecium tetraurelia strain d4-2]
MKGNQKNNQNKQVTGQQQQQDQLQKVDQIQREIQYYIYKDLENTLLMLGELEQTIETFKYVDDKRQSYLPIAFNKAILQANLSYGINFDQYNTNKNTHEKVFKDCSEEAIKIFKEVFETNEDGQKKNHTHPIISQICEFYKNKDFKNNKEFKQLPLQQVDREAQFNEKSLDKVIWGIQAVDKEFNDIREKPYPKPTAEELKKKIQERKKFCEEQLITNFNPDFTKQLKKNQDIGPSKENNDDKIQQENGEKEEEQKTDILTQNTKDILEESKEDNKDKIETEPEANQQQDKSSPIQNSQNENTAPEEQNFGKLGTQPKGVSGDMDEELQQENENGGQEVQEIQDKQQSK